jgi:hypothetical protein
LFNPRFQPSLARGVSSGKPVLFLFAELDPWTWIFKSEFQDLSMAHGRECHQKFEVRVIDKANHIFSSRESQEVLRLYIEEWLANKFSSTGGLA